MYIYSALFICQYVAEFTYDMVSPGPSVRIQGHRRRKKYGRKGQPSDFREGLSNAYVALREVWKTIMIILIPILGYEKVPLNFVLTGAVSLSQFLLRGVL